MNAHSTDRSPTTPDTKSAAMFNANGTSWMIGGLDASDLTLSSRASLSIVKPVRG